MIMNSKIYRIIIFCFSLTLAAVVSVMADENEQVNPPSLCVNGIMIDETGRLATINQQTYTEGDSIQGVTILKISNSLVQFEYKGEVFNKVIGEDCQGQSKSYYGDNFAANKETGLKNFIKSGIFGGEQRRSFMYSMQQGPLMAQGLFFIVWLLVMAGIALGYIVFLLSVWRGMKAHESIAQSLIEIASKQNQTVNP